MLSKLLQYSSAVVIRWFSKNYGRHLVLQYVSKLDQYEIVLDLRPGASDDLLICRKIFPRAHLIGVESHEPYTHNLQALDVKVIELNIERSTLSLDDASVDVIILNHILEHTKVIFWILLECSRVLKNGGVLIVGAPSLAAWHNRLLLLFFGLQPPAISSLSCHVRGFTSDDLILLFQSGGLVVEQRLSADFCPSSRAIPRILARLLPNLVWSIHILVRKNIDYRGSFFKVAPKFTETQFYIGGK
jgi:SAM-dependent methyltransferase